MPTFLNMHVFSKGFIFGVYLSQFRVNKYFLKGLSLEF